MTSTIAIINGISIRPNFNLYRFLKDEGFDHRQMMCAIDNPFFMKWLSLFEDLSGDTTKIQGMYLEAMSNVKKVCFHMFLETLGCEGFDDQWKQITPVLENDAAYDTIVGQDFEGAIRFLATVLGHEDHELGRIIYFSDTVSSIEKMQGERRYKLL